MGTNVNRPDLVTLICKLLQEHPMYQYRKDGRLPVLLAVSGQSTEDIQKLLQEILPNGQLLDTELSVTVYADDAENIGAELLTKAEDLSRFVTIGGVTASKATECALATLNFTSELPADEYPYRLYCGTDPEENDRLAKLCGCAEGQLVAFLRDDVFVVTSPISDILDGTEDKAQKELYERIAYNVNFGYQKYEDPRATRAEIAAKFEKDGYNYASSLKNVIHMRSKLGCCGITEPDLTKAAAQFAELMKKQPQIVEKLADLEHQRWLLEKLLDNRCLPKDLGVIYPNAKERTHGTIDGKKWHAALLPCCADHRLTLADWKTDGKNCRPELDPLDRMSLDVHKKCRELAIKRLPEIRDILETIRKSLMRNKDFPTWETALAHFYTMDASISQMYQKKRIAIRRYRWSKKEFLAALPKGNPLWVKRIKSNCDAIDENLHPLFEYVVDKDYKELNYLMIRQIPFSITHKKEVKLAKLFDIGTDDCQFAPWQMEPTDIIYIGFADSEEALSMLSGRAKHITEFLRHSCNETRTFFHVLIPGDIQSGTTADLQLHTVASRDPEVIREVIGRILGGMDIAYFDLTGGAPILSGPAERYAREKKIGAFYVSGTRMFNIRGAEELEYPALTKGISVLEMFIQTGAARLESEGAQISDLSNVYRDFWTVASGTEEWDPFCKFISEAYKTQKAQKTYKLTGTADRKAPVSAEMRIRSCILQKLLPVLRELEINEYIEDVGLEWIVGDLMRLTITASPSAVECLQSVLSEIVKQDRNDLMYDLKWTDKTKAIQAKPLTLTNAKLPKEHKDEFARVLRGLNGADLITGLNDDMEQTGKASFTISAVEFLSALRNSGKVLEYYIYNTALQECQFEDVDMSWKFYHSEDADSAHNEVDVICTKGTTSLFISAKNVKLDTFKHSSNYLNYVCYEVSVLAKRFGINARTVLAAPNVPQFDEKGRRSQRVQHAMSRGVYLLGDKCLKSGRLGEVLDNIARGEENWCECLLETT